MLSFGEKLNYDVDFYMNGTKMIRSSALRRRIDNIVATYYGIHMYTVVHYCTRSEFGADLTLRTHSNITYIRMSWYMSLQEERLRKKSNQKRCDYRQVGYGSNRVYFKNFSILLLLRK